ncbi:hypothetical protein CHLRE_17g698532v5 [Chlamydomonas reinhardtii]|uniref:Uncharacterized protein n=1 Tax=Chlamydomonas reinhardtii TaxID=3055 RepID=A0A2K3CNR9_CHLRE|nr:uncharacterized protein CHLRE_17g698532v5 [Chlamydomonas reinhardtii]PNW69927.1 hypothetical protein CHLRE_17g698532v5 [Chlamydomonas reinhardtii]
MCPIQKQQPPVRQCQQLRPMAAGLHYPQGAAELRSGSICRELGSVCPIPAWDTTRAPQL